MQFSSNLLCTMKTLTVSLEMSLCYWIETSRLRERCWNQPRHLNLILCLVVDRKFSVHCQERLEPILAIVTSKLDQLQQINETSLLRK